MLHLAVTQVSMGCLLMLHLIVNQGRVNNYREFVHVTPGCNPGQHWVFVHVTPDCAYSSSVN